MREIKFRGRKPNGVWIYGDLVTTETTDGKPTKKEVLPFDKANIDDAEYVEQDTIGQFTGLLDKNGKEIYEGDIVKWILTMSGMGVNGGYEEYEFEEIGEIKWDAGALQLGEYCAAGFAYESEDYAEIIGNVHDNPELLKSL